MAERGTRRAGGAVLEIRGLHVYYGQSHALQGVDLTLDHGVLSVVGRNGMGKTTLCKAIMGMVPTAAGSITFDGQPLNGRSPGEIARAGVGYVPQGRRLWRSLTVDEHLRLVARPRGAWTVDRIYSVFPRLAERKGNGGGQLSGGEQQMLAISRALLLDPKLLVMDEPTEGLAPVIVDQVADMLERLGREGDIHVLVIEQNIGVATSVSEDVAVMVNGRITRLMDSATLFADRDLQQRLLGVGRHGHDAEPEAGAAAAATPAAARGPMRIYVSNPAVPTRWSKPASIREIEGAARTIVAGSASAPEERAAPRRSTAAFENVVIVAGAFDSRGDALRFVRDVLKDAGLRTRLVDLSTSGRPSGIEVPPQQVAGFHPRGASGVFTGDRATAAAGMGLAFARYLAAQSGNVAGIVAVAGATGSAVAAEGMAALPIGTPKLLVSPLPPESLRTYTGAADLVVVPALADAHGLTALGRETLRNAAGAMAGMARARGAHPAPDAAGMTVLGLLRLDGVTGADARIAAGAAAFEVLSFAADGLGGARLEALARQGRIDVVVDVAMNEIADLASGGALPADRLRLDSVAYIGVCGGLDMIRLGPAAHLPAEHRGRRLAEYAPGLVAMRTTPDEAARIGRLVGERLNDMTGSVRLFLPQGGLSAFGRAGGPFHDPAADAALFAELERTVRQTGSRQLVRVPGHIDDPPLAEAVLAALRAHGAAPRRAAGGRP